MKDSDGDSEMKARRHRAGVLVCLLLAVLVTASRGATYETIGGSHLVIGDLIAFLTGGTFGPASWLGEVCSLTTVEEDVVWACSQDSFPVYSIAEALTTIGQTADVAYWSS